MHYIVKYKHENDTNWQSHPLWHATVNEPGWNPDDPEALCRTREDALKIFQKLKPSPMAHHLRLIECESNNGFSWAFGTDITPDKEAQK